MRLNLTEVKGYLAYLVSYLLSAGIWCSIRLKTNHTSVLLRKFHDISVRVPQQISDSRTTWGNTENFLVSLLCCMHAPFWLGMFVFQTESDSAFYTYGYTVKSSRVQMSLAGIKSLLYCLIFPFFTNMGAFLYCNMCFKSSMLINNLVQKIEQCPPAFFTTKKRIWILKHKSRIDDVLGDMQNIFSLPSFIIIVSNLLICGSALSIYLDNSWEDFHTMTFYIEITFYTLSSFGSLMFTLWFAGGIPIVENKFKDIFHKKMCQRMLFNGSLEDYRIEKWSIAKSDFVFTGCNIISYRRSTAFALVGTLVTCTVLVINK
ncbi:uncharacterized protein CDAR_272541 [Caerostris darwini]|uniref:Gustatory receptor n=1 Tax=Caerostris darwini TaxID=1538125 RepID=A0AAV4V0F7_9ARAC|nr:uncharacterized protein CDAR_272541 [Caerostris darwini]